MMELEGGQLALPGDRADDSHLLSVGSFRNLCFGKPTAFFLKAFPYLASIQRFFFVNMSYLPLEMSTFCPKPLD